MYSDSQSQINEQIKALLETSHALILDRNAGSRGQVRQFLLDGGMKLANIKTVESYVEAEETIKKFSPNLIFSDYEVGDKTGFDLLTYQRQTVKTEKQNIFFLFSERNSLSVASQAGELEVDAMLIRPYNTAQLKEKLYAVLSEKVVAKDYERKIQLGKNLLLEKKWDEAILIFKQAQTESKGSVSALYYEGTCYLEQKKYEKAVEVFRRGLEMNSKHLKCVLGLFDTFVETQQYEAAYELCIDIYKNHPINPARIPKLITVFVFSQHFETMMEFSELVEKFDESELDQTVRNYLSAGLAVCAKFCVRKNDEQRALEFYKKSILASKGKISVVREVFLDLTRLGKSDDVEILKALIPAETQKSVEFKALNFECLNVVATAPQVLQAGVELLKNGVKNPQLFEIVIRRSIELNRSQASIEQIVHEACQTYPEKSDFFRGLKAA